MNTNATTNATTTTGWVLYDGDCPLCTGWAGRYAGLLARAGFGLDTLQARHAALTEMLVVLPDGRTFGGADGFVEIARRLWWAWPFFAIAKIPGVMPLLRIGYRKLAANRNCFGGACLVPRHNPIITWFPLIVLPTLAFLFRNEMPAWIFMWTLAFAIYAGCKWLTYREATDHGQSAPLLRAAGYLLAWPGMDAKSFLSTKTVVEPPVAMEWVFATVKTLFGAALIWLTVQPVPEGEELLTGWLGMIGVVFLLHFGVFHLLSVAWRVVGVDAPPIMQAPLRAVSLAEFWGKRWNTAFHELVHRFTFRPLVRSVGVIGATLFVFMLSGIVHDLVISLPARGGYGLPTGYFLIQGLGIAVEHSHPGRRIGLGHGIPGWLFTMLITIGPVFWLFHPPFIHHVILPMLHAIGAT